MSERERSELRDPEIPAMVFGRPPTRPGSRGDEVGDDRDDLRDDGDVPGDPGDDVREGREVAGEPGDDVRELGDRVVDVREGGEVAGEPGDDMRELGARVVADDVGEGGAVLHDRGDEPGDGPLLGAAADLRQRWDAVQVGFVDDPRGAVEAAAGMVSEAAAALQSEIERRRAALADSRDGAAEGSTDALLAAFHDYRALFDRVVSL